MLASRGPPDSFIEAPALHQDGVWYWSTLSNGRLLRRFKKVATGRELKGSSGIVKGKGGLLHWVKSCQGYTTPSSVKKYFLPSLCPSVLDSICASLLSCVRLSFICCFPIVTFSSASPFSRPPAASGTLGNLALLRSDNSQFWEAGSWVGSTEHTPTHTCQVDITLSIHQTRRANWWWEKQEEQVRGGSANCVVSSTAKYRKSQKVL